MDVRLKEILTKINIDNSHHIYFETGKFTNLSFNKEKRIYSITLSVDEPSNILKKRRSKCFSCALY